MADTEPGVIHLTYTGVHAGTYLCLRFVAQMGAGTWGERRPQDRGAHLAYAPACLLEQGQAADGMRTCPDCLRLATCECGDGTCAACVAAVHTPEPMPTA